MLDLFRASSNPAGLWAESVVFSSCRCTVVSSFPVLLPLNLLPYGETGHFGPEDQLWLPGTTRQWEENSHLGGAHFPRPRVSVASLHELLSANVVMDMPGAVSVLTSSVGTVVEWAADPGSFPAHEQLCNYTFMLLEIT